MEKYLYLIDKKCLLLAGILLIMFSSCSEDVLKEVPLDFLAPEVNSYNTLAGIKQGINGLHFGVRDRFFAGRATSGTWTGNKYKQVLNCSLGTDVAYHGEVPGGNIQSTNYKIEFTSTNVSLSGLWADFYLTIQEANVLLRGINALDKDKWASDAQKNAYLAEAMFFRAFVYNYVVMLYGDAPLVTEALSSAKTDFVRDPKADIYKLMEEDLTFAAANLPEPGKEEAPGRITQGAAWHYLSEVYLNQSKFQLAVDAASKVIDGYHYALMTKRFGSTIDWFGSGDVYLDLFAYNNQNLPENTEAIWVMQYEPLVTGGGRYNEEQWGPAYFRMGNTPDGKVAFRGEYVNGKYTGYDDTLGRPVATARPTSYAAYYIWRSDWNNDIRNAKHNIKRNFYYDSPGSIYDKKKIDFRLYPPGTRDPIRDTCQYIFPFFMKNSSPMQHFTEPAMSGHGESDKDKYAIRLAETLLLRAEAYVDLGKFDLAAADINKIRNRANATPVLPAAVNLDYILDERARELYSEECRLITLRRMGKLVQRTRQYCDNPVFPGCNIQDYNVLLPIPQSQIDLNINAEMQQNPGYN